ncbi:MAG: Ig-like domain-containing protein [Bacteroidaceae bacterium]|nr:Ig-like domain-containing protein [Bacteroidaceae bacterium]
MNDLDLTSWINENSSTAGWIPVGFSGSGNFIFDGDNHTISGLWVNSTGNNVGLFSSLDHATIKNLTVITSTRKVKGGDNTGILAGRLTDASIENVSVQGEVQGNSPVGGIVGEAASVSLNNCTVQAILSGNLRIGGVVGSGSYILDGCGYSGSLSSTSSNAYIGGLAGSGSVIYETENGANYNIRMCKADVTISATGTGSKCGGLVGGDTGAMILQSTASGTITATGSDSYAGGLVGYLSSGSIMNCYSTANTSSTLYAAGLVGYNEKSAITKCYASGNVNSTYYGAGVIGYNDGANATLTNSVAMGTIVNVSDQSGWGIRVLGGYKNSAPEPDNSNFGWSGMQISVNGVPKTVTENDLDGLSLSTAQTKQSATYTAIDWDFNDIWTIEEGVGYPKLKWEGETGPTVVLATGVTLDQTSITLITAGQTATLTATVEPADVTDGSVSWTSSDISVATVSSEGVVTAVANGTATITATTNDGSNLTATCTVTVNITTTVLATGVTLSQSSITLTNAGETATLTATVAPGNVTDGSVTWTSSDETVATVNGEGVVTAVANGSATITVTTNDGTNLTATCTITVAIPEDNPDPDTDISQIANVVYMESTEVSAGSEETLSIKMKNTDGIQTLQFDLYLPEGVEVLTDEDDFELIDLSTERTTARKMDQFSVQRMSNGAYRVLINSSRGYTFDGTDGEIATVQVGISETMTPGNYPVIFRDIVLVNTSSVGYETDYVKCSLNIPDYKPGDVNNDTKVNAIDLNAITNYILERRDFPFTFNKKAANINGDKETNGDEKINAIDLNAVTNMILNEGATTSSANRRRGILIPD